MHYTKHTIIALTLVCMCCIWPGGRTMAADCECHPAQEAEHEEPDSTEGHLAHMDDILDVVRLHELEIDLGVSGDAIYIPSLWWHAVESLESFNVLVNYWWGGIGEQSVSPNDSLLHAMLTIAELDDAQRQAWKTFFDYYVFREGEDPEAHLPEGLHDIVTSLTPEQSATIRRFLAEKLAGGS